MSLKPGMTDPSVLQQDTLVNKLNNLTEYLKFVHNSQQDSLQAIADKSPRKLTKSLRIERIIIEDLMDAMHLAYATYINRKVSNGAGPADIKKVIKDLPMSFYYHAYCIQNALSLTTANVKTEAKAQLFEAVTDLRDNQAVIDSNSRPDFYDILKNSKDKQTLMHLTGLWTDIVREFAVLLADDAALDAYTNINTLCNNIHDNLEEMMEEEYYAQVSERINSADSNNPQKQNNDDDDSFVVHPVEDLGDVQEEMGKLVGLDKPKALFKTSTQGRQFRDILKNSFNADAKAFEQFQHFVFIGNPGTGKTTFARIIGKMMKEAGLLKKGHVVEVDSQHLIAGYIGQTGIKTAKAIKAAMDGVLFIDEAYLLNDNGEKGFGKEAIGKLVKDMDTHKDRMTIIFVGYPKLMEQLIESNPGMARRVMQIEFDDFDLDQLMAIMDKNLDDMQLSITDRAREEFKKRIETLKNTESQHFGNAGSVKNLLNLAVDQHAIRMAEKGLISKFNESGGALSPADKRAFTSITKEDVTKIPQKSKISQGKPKFDL